MKLSFGQVRMNAAERLKLEHGIIVQPHDTSYMIAKMITDVQGKRSPNRVLGLCKHIVKKYAIEYIVSK